MKSGKVQILAFMLTVSALLACSIGSTGRAALADQNAQSTDSPFSQANRLQLTSQSAKGETSRKSTSVNSFPFRMWPIWLAVRRPEIRMDRPMAT